MPYTPVELRHVKIGRALFGFKREETERLLDEIADSFEDVWRDRGELADQVEDLQKDLDEYKQREHLLTQTLVAAERSAAEARDSARREAELIVAEAHGEARSVLRGAQGERERLVMEARRVETLLRAALGLVQEGGAPPSWPDRSDTREFKVVEPPADEPEAEVEAAPEPEPADEPQASRDFNWR
ncbi:MAG TPA: DivIVA domain-containing protein [Gaiellaceae bacterium]